MYGKCFLGRRACSHCNDGSNLAEEVRFLESSLAEVRFEIIYMYFYRSIRIMKVV